MPTEVNASEVDAHRGGCPQFMGVVMNVHQPWGWMPTAHGGGHGCPPAVGVDAHKGGRALAGARSVSKVKVCIVLYCIVLCVRGTLTGPANWCKCACVGAHARRLGGPGWKPICV